MSSYTLSISDTRFIFNNDYGTIAFYSISAGKITKGEKLLDATQKYIRLKLTDTTLYVSNGLSAPSESDYSSYDEYGPDENLADAWNGPGELIVGTGDLRPSGADIVPNKYSLAAGILLTSPSSNTIGIYTLV